MNPSRPSGKQHGGLFLGKPWYSGFGRFGPTISEFNEPTTNRDLQVYGMGNCDWCNLSEEDRQFQVYESESWSVFLSDEQDYIGRCILVLKRHCNSMSELTDAEWDELRSLVCKVEKCLKSGFGAALCNWSCLMNSFYKEASPDPHLHIHVRPRYDKPVMLNGNTYTDCEFGHHYALNKSGAIPAGDKQEVFVRLKKWLNG